jgi:putative endonuclease
MQPKYFYVYILASKVGGTLYIGVTNDLVRRVWEHKSKLIESFTEKYGVSRLVYFEQFDDPENAIKREKRLKKWNRGWKVRLIEESNPSWDDLFPGIGGVQPTAMPRRSGIQQALRS